MTKDPCRNCPERAPGCHTRCPDGIEQDRLDKERRERIKAERDKDNGWPWHERDVAGKRMRRG